ncbi:hypothetical protein D9M69_498670 [compost metagenome]
MFYFIDMLYEFLDVFAGARKKNRFRREFVDARVMAIGHSIGGRGRNFTVKDSAKIC